jgi:hypothetical protein
VFHPGATDIGAAVTIPLGLSEERRGVDVTIQLVPTATISGTVTAPSGELPPMLSVRLVPAGPQTELLAGAGLGGVTAQFLVALPDLETGEWNDPTLLEQLAKSSTTVTLRDGETTRQNHRIGGGVGRTRQT